MNYLPIKHLNLIKPVHLTPGVNKVDRVYSLDALRGFDMFWISGGDVLMVSLAALTKWPIFNWAAEQMRHASWNGFHFYDMIFPLFLFIAGVSMPFSLAKRKQRGEAY
jgi:predicted acyltransferase